MSEIHYIVGILLLILTVMIVIVQHNKLKRNLELTKSDYQADMVDKDSTITFKNKKIKNLEDKISSYEALIVKIKENPLYYIKFTFPNGDIVNTVKVKTLVKEINTNKKVVSIKATTRKKEKGIFQDIPVLCATRNI